VIPFLSGAKVVGAAFSGISRTYDLVSVTAELPGRAMKVLGDAEGLVTRVGVLVGRIERIATEASGVTADAAAAIDRVDAVNDAAAAAVERIVAVTDRASAALGRVEALNDDAAAAVRDAAEVVGETRAVLARAAEITDGAERAVAEAQRTAGAADALLRRYEPMALKAAPLAEKFIDSLSEEEVDAAIRLVDELPRLTERLRHDILPILATLDRVGPDINELLKVTYDVRRAILGIPGFGFFKKRGEEILEELEHEEQEQHAELAAAHRWESEKDRKADDKDGAAP
jgi:hypothetical protein